MKGTQDDEYYITILEERGYRIEGLVMKPDSIASIQWMFKSGRVDDALRELSRVFPELKNCDLQTEEFYRKHFLEPKPALNEPKNYKYNCIVWNGQTIIVKTEEGNIADVEMD